MTCILLLVQQFEANNPDAFISKTKHFLSTFFCIFQIHIKFWTFSKKRLPHGLCISEITSTERRA